MQEIPTCPKCNGKLKVSGERRTQTFYCESCGWTNDLRLYRARRIIERGGEAGHVAIQAHHAALGTPFREDAKRLHVPSLCVAAGDSPARRETVAAIAPGAEFVRIDGTGHFVYLESPEIFNSILDDFIRRRVLSGAIKP